MKQYNLGCLSHLSYLVADVERGVAAIVDPQRDVDAYLEDAQALGVEIRWVLLTHFHADFVAGHLELQERTGAEILLGAAGQADYAVTPMRDGERLRLGAVELEFLATPGHTPEGTSIVVRDLDAPEQPAHVLTGDTLFVGDVGRPDLLASVGVTAEELAGMLYDSLHGKLLTLPDETIVYPAHGAGSACGKSIGEASSTTIGEQRQWNAALQPMDRSAFIAMVTAGLPPAPRYFAHDARMNKEQRGLLAADPAAQVARFDAAALLAARDAGAVVLDVRPTDAYAAGHLLGSRHADLDGRFAHWVGSQLDPRGKVAVIVAAGDEDEAVRRLARIGIDSVVGLLVVGTEGLDPRLAGASFARVTGQDLEQELAAAAPPLVVDLRSAAEHQDNGVAASISMPLTEIEERLAELPRDRRMVFVCNTGYRSSVGCAIAEAAGLDVRDLRGGLKAWRGEAAQSCALGG